MRVNCFAMRGSKRVNKADKPEGLHVNKEKQANAEDYTYNETSPSPICKANSANV